MATTLAPSSSAAVTEGKGIPGAQFVEDVQTYLTQAGLDVNLPSPFSNKGVGTIKMDACLLERYKLVELKLQAQQRDLQFSFAQKIPFL